MQEYDATVTRMGSNQVVLATNALIRNTYLLLSGTLLFSALTAYLSVVTRAPVPNPLFVFLITFGLIQVTFSLRNSASGLLGIFALTGFMGYTLGPLLNFFLYNFNNGPQLVGTSFAATGLIFMALSAYALSTRRNFSYMNGFMFALSLVVLVGFLANLFFQIPALQLLVSGAIILSSAGHILMQTSQMIHAGEDNYISATISLYLSFYNIFINLLSILAMFSGQRRDN